MPAEQLVLVNSDVQDNIVCDVLKQSSFQFFMRNVMKPLSGFIRERKKKDFSLVFYAYFLLRFRTQCRTALKMTS